MITNDWLAPLKPEFKKPYYRDLYNKVADEYAHHLVYPKAGEMFKAFELTPFNEVKAVILGQVCYRI